MMGRHLCIVLAVSILLAGCVVDSPVKGERYSPDVCLERARDAKTAGWTWFAIDLGLGVLMLSLASDEPGPYETDYSSLYYGVAVLDVGVAVYTLLQQKGVADEWKHLYGKLSRKEHDEFPAVLAELAKCPSCGSSVEGGWQACPHCGKTLRLICLQCTTLLEPTWKVCPKCAAVVPPPK
ncbi:MAG: zinc ribbon domain-containing protein [Candidatus Binatia bacterium]